MFKNNQPNLILLSIGFILIFSGMFDLWARSKRKDARIQQLENTICEMKKEIAE